MHIELDYAVSPRPRWGYGRPANPDLYRIIDQGRPRYEGHLRQFLAYRDDLGRIDCRESSSEPGKPAWENPWFSGLDAVALYAFLRLERSQLYLEIGSGTSTKFARQAITDGQLPTRVVSIDPQPRADIDVLCTEVIRQPLEDVEVRTFEMLQAGDILFFDGSHRIFTNSDTAVFFLEILPRLRPGVLVHVHDIFLPYDYPPEWNSRFYSEQYVLAAWLLGGSQSLQIEMPHAFVGNDAVLRQVIEPIWAPHLSHISRGGGSFWFRTTGSREQVPA